MNREHFQNQFHSFPSPFRRALEKNYYTPGTSQFSVTTLISPPQRTWLRTQGEEILHPYGHYTALLGTAMHWILENNVDESTGEIAERRLYSDITLAGSPTSISVSGQLDFYEHKTLSDYKLTGGFQKEIKEDHWKQVNMNGRLAELNGIEVENVAVIYVQKDWSSLRASVDPKYPQTPFNCIIKPYDQELAIKLFARTVADHVAASLGNPRKCTPDEQWRKPTTYALKKPENQRARKVCDSYSEAEELQKTGEVIEVRPGEATYCESFCGYKHICPQYLQENMNK